MRIAICGSMTFAKEMIEAKKGLEMLGHDVKVPCDTDMVANGEHDPGDLEADRKRCRENDIIRRCFRNIEASDAILVLNHDKNGIKGYVGASTFAEIVFAHHFNKKIFLLYGPPDIEKQRHMHEIKIMQPTVLKGDLKKIA